MSSTYDDLFFFLLTIDQYTRFFYAFVSLIPNALAAVRTKDFSLANSEKPANYFRRSNYRRPGCPGAAVSITVNFQPSGVPW